MSKKIMKSKIDDGYEDAPEKIARAIERGHVIRDLLPPPDKMIMKRGKDKEVVADISEADLKYLKEEARELGVSSKVWIRGVIHNLVNSYVNSSYNDKRQAK
jgi:hypothetical protein